MQFNMCAMAILAKILKVWSAAIRNDKAYKFLSPTKSLLFWNAKLDGNTKQWKVNEPDGYQHTL